MSQMPWKKKTFHVHSYLKRIFITPPRQRDKSPPLTHTPSASSDARSSSSSYPSCTGEAPHAVRRGVPPQCMIRRRHAATCHSRDTHTIRHLPSFFFLS